ncbi:MAG: pilin [Candidatus Saccharibacteria bacterium]|nr:pilin [Candidatus Saccharibacteria bacterium]
MKNVKKILVLAATVIAALAVTITPAYAASDPCQYNSSAAICSDLKNSNGLPTSAKKIINAALLIVGMLAVAMIIFSGARYIMAHGDKAQIKQAQMTLTYSVVGLVVAILSYAIVNFVLSKI